MHSLPIVNLSTSSLLANGTRLRHTGDSVPFAMSE